MFWLPPMELEHIWRFKSPATFLRPLQSQRLQGCSVQFWFWVKCKTETNILYFAWTKFPSKATGKEHRPVVPLCFHPPVFPEIWNRAWWRLCTNCWGAQQQSHREALMSFSVMEDQAQCSVLQEAENIKHTGITSSNFFFWTLRQIQFWQALNLK